LRAGCRFLAALRSWSPTLERDNRAVERASPCPTVGTPDPIAGYWRSRNWVGDPWAVEPVAYGE
jgi:hypothetical protein